MRSIVSSKMSGCRKEKIMVGSLGRLIQLDKQAEFAEQKVRALIDASPNAIVVIRQDGLIETSNSKAESWFGYSSVELINQPLEILLPERFREIHVAHRLSYARDPIPRPMGTGLDLLARR